MRNTKRRDEFVSGISLVAFLAAILCLIGVMLDSAKLADQRRDEAWVDFVRQYEEANK